MERRVAAMYNQPSKRRRSSKERKNERGPPQNRVTAADTVTAKPYESVTTHVGMRIYLPSGHTSYYNDKNLQLFNQLLRSSTVFCAHDGITWQRPRERKTKKLERAMAGDPQVRYSQ